MPDTSVRTQRSTRRFTRRSVKIKDALARVIITVGGIGTLVSILAVGLFLIWVAWPLFVPPAMTGVRSVNVAWEQAPTRVAVDENGLIGFAIESPGSLRVFRLSDGLLLSQRSLAEDPAVTAWTTAGNAADAFAVGLSNGQVRIGSIQFKSKILSDDDAQRALSSQQADGGVLTFPYDDGLAEQMPDGNVRVHRAEIALGDPIKTGVGDKIEIIDYFAGLRGSRLVVASADGKLMVMPVGKRATLSGVAAVQSDATHEVQYQSVREERPNFILISDAQLFLAWSDGMLARYDARNLTGIRLAETLDLVPDADSQLTALAPLVGRGTLVSGDSAGRTQAWFLTKPDGAETIDRSRLTLAHVLPQGTAAVTALAASDRNRVIAVGYRDGQVQVSHVTTARGLVSASIQEGAPITGLAIAPKQDGLLAATADGIGFASLQLWHPEASFTALFTPIWYQDYLGPAHVWQSTSGGQANEPKLGLMPLVFGTIKATIYSLFFGVPIALLAAIYTSEFLSREARARVKPTVELMASLPSVVLGYLAAFVIAPLVARWIPEVLLSFLTIPLMFLLSAYFVQLLPDGVSRWVKSYRFLLACVALPLGAGVAVVLGPHVERELFQGSIIRWLDSGEGSSVGGWLILLLPVSAIVMGYFTSREITPRLRRISAEWSSAKCAFVDLFKFLASTIVCVVVAFALAFLLDRLGYDPRGTYIGPYIQRNAMIVGFAMGFAIIPLIYTIAEDALSSVPEHLRSASLGAGATPWQTTVRIIVPTAMSGLFSAIMIGLGRAVGETMIVLMAAGNTPIMEWNIFNGFRTLSANLAVELPEAEQGGTHFRVLFLTALLLFAMTFVINTLAEWVRQRFRKRAYQL